MTTTNLGLTLPTVGGDSDTWGTELNTAITALDTWAGGAASPLLKSGGTLTGPLVAAVGTVLLPGLTFAGDLDCGLYRIGANNIGIAVNGAKVLDIATTGLTVVGTLTTPALTITQVGTGLNAIASIAGDVTKLRGFSFSTGATLRWLVYADTTAESGTNAGSNFALGRYDDAGGFIANALAINRATGAVTITVAPVFTDASGTRTALGLGTSAVVDTGTSGTKVALTDGVNTWSGAQTLSALATLSAGANMTPATTPATNAIGYLGAPVVDRAGDVTLAMSDAGKTQRYTGSGGNTHTIPANGSVAFPIGTVLGGNNDGSGTLTVAITTDTLKWLAASTGSRTVAVGGTWSAQKLTATTWRITGDLLS